MIRSLLILIMFASLCFSKDSVSVNVSSSNGILQTKIISYDADQLLQAWQYNLAMGTINPVIPAEMQQYIVRDTTQKMPPFIGGSLTITRKDLGKDTTALDAVNAAIVKIIKKKVVVK